MAERSRDARFLNAFMSVWSIHKTNEPDKIILSSYKKALEFWEIEQIESAFGYALTSLKFFPKPAELIEYLNRWIEPKQVTAQAHAGYLTNAIMGKDYLNPSGWRDEPATARLLRGRFNIDRLHETSLESDLKWIEKDFIEAYSETSDFVQDMLQIEESTNPKITKDIASLTREIG